MPIRSCVECSISLDDRPRILVDSEQYCFRCAKQFERDLVESAEQKYERDLKIYQERQLAFQKRHPNFGSDLPWVSWGEVVYGFFGWLIFPVIGAIAGVLICQSVRRLLWKREQDKLNEEFESKNPMPTQPQPTEIDLELDESRFEEPIVETNYRRQILLRDDYTCQSCEEQKAETDLEVHHILMRAKCGTDHPTNLVTLCLHCHDRERWFGHKRMFPTTI